MHRVISILTIAAILYLGGMVSASEVFAKRVQLPKSPLTNSSSLNFDARPKDELGGEVRSENVESRDLLKDCNNIIDEHTRAQCYSDIAERTGNISICTEQLEGSYQIQSCYSAVLKKHPKAELCETISDLESRNGCYLRLAHSSIGIAACDRIKDEGRNSTFLRLCFRDIDYSIEECGSLLTSNVRDFCYSLAAEKLKLHEVCANIEDASIRYECTRRIAHALEDSEICSEIESSEERDNCLSEISRLSQGSPEVCKKIDALLTRSQCFEGLAFKHKNAKLCEELPSQGARESCRIGVAKTSNSISLALCEKIATDSEQFRCYHELAINSQDSSQCHNIADKALSEMCLGSVAIRLRVPELCEQLSTQGDLAKSRDMCYFRYASELKEWSYCRKIHDEGSRDGCYRKQRSQR